MNLFNDKLNQAFQSRSVLKVITGIDNTDISQIIRIAEASQLANATYLDTSANVKLVKVLKSCCNLPICVSSVDPVDMYNCVSSGADLVELGNYDFFYKKGIYITAEQIIDLFMEVKLMLPRIDICVTIPYYLDIREQICLTRKLDSLGANIIQTEGISNFNYCESKSNICNKDFSSLSNSFIPSLLSTYILSNLTKMPILASSGFKNITSPISKFYGASGVGISSSFKNEKTITNMLKYIIQTSESLSLIHDTKIANISDFSDFLTLKDCRDNSIFK